MIANQINIPTLRFPEFSGEWEERKLEEVTTKINSGKTPLGGNSVYTTEGIPFIRSQNVTGDRLILEEITYISTEINSTMKNSIVKPKDVLLNITGASLGRSCVVPEDFQIGNVNQHVCIVRIDDKNDPYFIQPIFSSTTGQKLFDSLQTGSGREGLNFQAIKGIKLSFPSLPEQQKIALFLTAIDTKIELLTKKKNLLEQYKKGVMQQIFSQKLRFKDDDGNEFPEWVEAEIGNFLEEYVEKVPASTEIEILTSSRTGLRFQRDYFDNRELDNEGEYKVVPRGYMTYRHMSDDSTFKFNINDLVDRGAVSKEYPVFTTRDLDSIFLQYLLNCGKDFEEFAVLQKQGGTRTRLYFKNLKKFRTLIPSLPEQKKIVDFLKKLNSKIETINNQFEGTRMYKKGLLQQLFV